MAIFVSFGGKPMLYYKVKEEYDNKPRFKERSNHQLKQDGILVGNELYTPCERAKIMNGNWMFDEVQISKFDTHIFFGARFANTN